MIVVRDTREKQGWDFIGFPEVENICRLKLDEGDYTTASVLYKENETGQKIMRVERKASIGELAINMGKKRKQFEAELQRLSVYQHKFLVFEFDRDDIYKFPYNSGIPKDRWYRINKYGKRVKNVKMSGPYIASILDSWLVDYNLEVFYCGNRTRAEEKTVELLNAYC